MTRQLLCLMNAEQAEAFSLLVAQAGAGDGAAACRLGDMYREGLGGLRYSPKQTHHWYAKSALMGDATGQNNLGACYEHGLGCAQSYVKAVKWYRLAAARNVGTANMNLGYCYLNGHGLPADKAEALRLFRLAVEQGEEKAVKEVERLEGDRAPRAAAPTCRSASPGTREEHLPVSSHSASCLVTVPGDASSTRVQQNPHRDGPSVQLESPAGPAASIVQRGDLSTEDVRPVGKAGSTVQWVQGVESADETESGKHFGTGGGVVPPEEDIPEAERIRRELVEVLGSGVAEDEPVYLEASEDELFPIYAECRMKPDFFVPELAAKYAAYLREREQTKN